MTNKEFANILNIQIMADHLAFDVVEYINTNHIDEMTVVDVWNLRYRVEPLDSMLARKLDDITVSKWVTDRNVATNLGPTNLAAFIISDYERVKTARDLSHTLYDLMQK